MTTQGTRSAGRSWLLAGRARGGRRASSFPLSVTGSCSCFMRTNWGRCQAPRSCLCNGELGRDGSSWSAVISRLQRQGYNRWSAPPTQLRGPSVERSLPGQLPAERSRARSFLVGQLVTAGFCDHETRANGQTPMSRPSCTSTRFIPGCQNQTLAEPVVARVLPRSGDGVQCGAVSAAALTSICVSRPNPPYTGFQRMFRQRCAAETRARRAFGSCKRAGRRGANWASRPGPPAWAEYPVVVLESETEDHAVPPSLQEQMSTNAGAHISYVKAGSLVAHYASQRGSPRQLTRPSTRRADSERFSQAWPVLRKRVREATGQNTTWLGLGRLAGGRTPALNRFPVFNR